MKIIFVLVLSLFLSCHTSILQADEDMTETDKINYSVGYKVGQDLLKQKIEMREDKLLGGIEDAVNGKSALDYQQRRRALMTLQQRAIVAQQADRKAIADKNLDAGKSFLAANAEKQDVTRLPSGLQYRVITSGKGKVPGVESTVVVHYRGSLIDGSVFDSSYKRNKPATFKVNRVVKGWSEALQLMREGDHWELFVPPHLAYGERGVGLKIPPNSTLIFEIELISVK